MDFMVASSTQVIAAMFGNFWLLLSGPGVYVMGGLIAVALIFWGFRALKSQFTAREDADWHGRMNNSWYIDDDGSDTRDIFK